MIRELHLKAIAPVAAGLSASGVAFAARQNTPLSTVLAHSFPYDESQVGDSQTTLMQSTALMLDEGDAGHSVEMDSIVSVVSAAITKHCTFARNVVLPIIGKVYASVRERTEETGPIPYNVEQVWLHEAITSAAVNQLIDRYTGNTTVVAPAISNAPERSEEELSGLVTTGSSSYDAILADLLTKVSIVDIYHRYFASHEDLAVESKDGYKHIRFNILPMAANELLVVHLLARGLLDNPHEGSNVSLMEYRSGLTGYIEATGCALQLLLTSWDRFAKVSQLVIRQVDVRPSADKTIYVYGPVYQQFLEKGGDAEAIIGALVSNQRQLKYLGEFVDALPKLKMAYTQWLSRQDNARLAASGKIICDAVVTAVTEAINTLTDADNVCGCSKEQMHREAARIIASVPESEWLKAPYKTIRVVVCGAMFPTSNAFRILSLIDQETERHGHEDVRVAAYHAIKTLLVEHFMTQVVEVS